MSRLVNLRGTLIDLEYIYKIDTQFPDINSYNEVIKDSHIICNHESGLNVLYRLLPKSNDWKSVPNLSYSTYKITLYTFDKDKTQTFYFTHKDDFNKFIKAYKEYKKVTEILEI